MDLNKLVQNKIFKYALTGIGALIVLLMVLRLGMVVGVRKEGFAHRWSENYHRNFAGGPREGFLREFGRRDFMGSHGTFGTIITMDLPVIIMNSKDGVEKVVVLGNDTVIRRFRNTITASDLTVNDAIVVIGSPNDAGQIEAKLIRVTPSSY